MIPIGQLLIKSINIDPFLCIKSIILDPIEILDPPKKVPKPPQKSLGQKTTTLTISFTQNTFFELQKVYPFIGLEVPFGTPLRFWTNSPNKKGEIGTQSRVLYDFTLTSPIGDLQN
jgi:hypothetical protein